MINIRDAKRERHEDESIDYIPIFNNGIFSVSYAYLQPSEEVPLHRHQKTHHVYFAEKGILTIIVDGAETVLEEKSFIDVPPGKAHKIVNNSEVEVQFITFEVPPDDNDIEMLK
jgi:mannose-6-phosphate isomerase-like protein (cupin superfamily)